MAVNSTRIITISQVGDGLTNNAVFPAAANGASPGDIDVIALAAGNNTITLPTGGVTPTGATLVPPAGNTQALILKGVAGDTGIAIAKTDPCSLSFENPPPASFVVNAAGIVNGFRVVWT